MAESSSRIGLGYDIHRLEAGDGLMLGGVAIPCPYRAIAHSDGDVLLHACCDAILGALALGDIGSWFPDTDPAYADADSSELLRHILADARVAAWRIGNLDANIIAQKPRLGPYRDAIRGHLAECLNCDLDQVSVKFRTKEGCDATGRVEAIEAQVVAQLWPASRAVGSRQVPVHS